MSVDIAQRVEELTGYKDPDGLAAAIETAMRGLGSRLDADANGNLAQSLPPQLGQPLERGTHDPAVDLDTLYHYVAKRSGVRPGVGLELTQTLLALVAEYGDREAIAAARSHLPRSWATLVEPPVERSVVAHPPPQVPVEPGTGHTLATGRPGSRHPIADSAPYGGQRDSVTTNDEPHRDTKLSASRGISSERQDETLASGQPGSRERPLARGNDE